jgi:uncharacterized protein (TIGR02391 family)
VKIEWMRQKLEAFLVLCEQYEEPNPSVTVRLRSDVGRGGGSAAETRRRVEAAIDDALPTVEQIIHQLDPKLLIDGFGTAFHIGGLSATIQQTRKALAVLRDREEWKANLEPDAPSICADKLHPTIWRAAAPMWETREYQHAAQDACIYLSEHIKTKAGSHLNDRELVAQVFKPEPPTPSQSRLHFPGNPADKNWQSRQQGLHHLAQGAFAGIRNIAVHVKGTWSEHEALEQLAVLSVIARWADETQLVST